MTELEWLDCNDPDKLFFDRFAITPRPTRQLRLFACGCCRQIWDYIPDERCRNAVLVAELEADGKASESVLNEALDLAEQACDEIGAEVPISLEQTAAFATLMAIRAPSDVAVPVANVLAKVSMGPVHKTGVKAQLAFLASLFRDIFGNPFRVQQIEQSWMTDEIIDLALTIYDSPQTSYYHLLSKYLESSKCSNKDIMKHCMCSLHHVKGCWVIDLLLNKV